MELIVNIVEVQCGQMEADGRWRKDDIVRRSVVNGLRACRTTLMRRRLR